MKAQFRGQGALTPALSAKGKPLHRHWLWKKVPLFEFTNSTEHPLTFTDTDGTEYRPDNHFVTDGGSVPPPLWNMPFISLGPWDFPRAYPFHDSGFTYGGLYIRKFGELNFKFVLMSRKQLNDLLCRMIPADGGSAIDEGSVSVGLLFGSYWSWKPDVQSRNRTRDGIAVK